MQDVLWCFSQVKGTIDVGVTEGRFCFPFCWLWSQSTHLSPTSCTGLACDSFLGVLKRQRTEEAYR
uniref:Uncharacterized protein n=1 Tax=Pavo cristatus TaxID=9049 RepID=A0A8C9ENB8_PAVCR